MHKLNIDLVTFPHADSCEIQNDQLLEISVKSVFCSFLFFIKLIYLQECKIVSGRKQMSLYSVSSRTRVCITRSVTAVSTAARASGGSS